MMKGAQPSDTVRFYPFLQGNFNEETSFRRSKKGAFSEDEAEKRFTGWMEGKNKKVRKISKHFKSK